MKEIEKKYLVKYLVKDIDKCEKVLIEQSYLNIEPDPIIRLRKWNDEYFLTYKNRANNTNKELSIADEYELPISIECYNNLSKKVEGNVIYKDRYLIPLNKKLVAEVDIYHGKLEGLRTVEVEFNNIQEFDDFVEPDWFGKDITNQKKYINSQLSKINNIDELEESNG